MSETYVSVDIEADGPIPGPHSMLSLAAVAFDLDGRQLGTFSANLETLPEASGHPDTMAWWAGQPEAWEASRRDRREPSEAIPAFVAWVRSLPGKPVFVAYPAGYDFTWVYWYMMRFVGESPFSHSALDIKTLAMALMGCGYRDATKKNMPAAWFRGAPQHSHVALDDAIGQGILFVNMMREMKARP